VRGEGGPRRAHCNVRGGAADRGVTVHGAPALNVGGGGRPGEGGCAVRSKVPILVVSVHGARSLLQGAGVSHALHHALLHARLGAQGVVAHAALVVHGAGVAHGSVVVHDRLAVVMVHLHLHVLRRWVGGAVGVLIRAHVAVHVWLVVGVHADVLPDHAGVLAATGRVRGVRPRGARLHARAAVDGIRRRLFRQRDVRSRGVHHLRCINL